MKQINMFYLMILGTSLAISTIQSNPDVDEGNIRTPDDAISELKEEVHKLQEMTRRTLMDVAYVLESVKQTETTHEETNIKLNDLQSKVNENAQLLLSLNESASTCIPQINKQDREDHIMEKVTDTETGIRTFNDCMDVQETGTGVSSGKNMISLNVSGNNQSSKVIRKEVFCDLETNGGGWLTFMKRVDSGGNFPDSNWNDYRDGFGDLDNSFWLGNKFVHYITKQKRYKLRIDLEDWEGETRYAEYDDFRIGTLEEKFVLHIGDYNGDAGQDMGEFNGFKFSTFDADNDPLTGINCAEQYRGGWWYYGCKLTGGKLTGEYLQGQNDRFAKGIIWKSFKGFHYSLKRAEMKIRPMNFQ